MDVPTPLAVAPYVIRLAQADDVPSIDWLDTFGTSPHRDISRHVDKYFGSVDPSIHEQNLIFLAELRPEVATDQPFRVIGKVELLLAPASTPSDIGYIKRVVTHPAWRGQGIARAVLNDIAHFARERGLTALDLHVWEGNTAALHLYESLGFVERQRELYLRQNLAESLAPVVDSPRPSERISPP